METISSQHSERKPYEAPDVVYEAHLEVQAGSQEGMFDPLHSFEEEK